MTQQPQWEDSLNPISAPKAKCVYFIGIGGSGMMPLAFLAQKKGWKVLGADIGISGSKRKALEKEGIIVYTKHDPKQLQQAHVVVYSTAIRKSHPERLAASELAASGRLHLFHRMDFLNLLVSDKALQIAIAGTHGKTSTASLAGWALLQMGLDPEILVGGHPLYLKTGIRKGEGKLAVFETDESDGSFLKTKARLRLLLNIDQDHLDHYGSFGSLKAAFREFLLATPKDGLAIANADDPNVRSLITDTELLNEIGNRLFWYSTNPKTAALLPEAIQRKGLAAEFAPTSDALLFRQLPNTKPPDFLLVLQESLTNNPKHNPEQNLSELTPESETRLRVSLPGRHFASNALGLFCLLRLAFPSACAHTVLSAFQSFPGVERRMQLLSGKGGIAIYDDYAHHPTEIEAVLGALRLRLSTSGQLVALFEPHRYTRTQEHHAAFAHALQAADEIWLLPLFPAGERPIPEVESSLVAKTLIEDCAMPKDRVFEINPHMLPKFLARLRKGDILVGLGAGNVSSIIRKALDQRAKKHQKRKSTKKTKPCLKSRPCWY